MEESFEICSQFYQPLCYINKINARGNLIDVCDKHFSVRAHFAGKLAQEKLKERIKEHSHEVNILGLLGKQIRITKASLKIV